MPIVNNQTLFKCDADNDGITTFDLTKLNSLINGGNRALNNVIYNSNLATAQGQINPILNPSYFQNITINQGFASVSNKY